MTLVFVGAAAGCPPIGVDEPDMPSAFRFRASAGEWFDVSAFQCLGRAIFEELDNIDRIVLGACYEVIRAV